MRRAHLPQGLLLAWVLQAACWLPAQAQTPPVQAAAAATGRGQLLYGTHCVECHSTQIHWRSKRQATDWASLVTQVNRWQSTAGLGWRADDVDEVARHLNDTVYHFQRTGPSAIR